MLNGLALFAGIGGLELGLRKWVRTVCYVERDPYAIAVLRSHKAVLDDAPIWDDVATFDGKPWRGKVDVISGGFPCQDISHAGKGRGIKEGTRSGLWYEFIRIITEVRPSFVFVENVSALTNRGLDIVLGQLSEAGYDARWTDLRASDVGAPHRRERMFILAYAKHSGYIHRQSQEQPREARKSSQRNPLTEGSVAHTIRGGFETRCRLQQGEEEAGTSDCTCINWNKDPADLDPSSESFVGRVADGISRRVDRIKCLGNAVVPDQAERAWEILTEIGTLQNGQSVTLLENRGVKTDSG